MATCVDISAAKYPTEREGQSVHPMEGTSLAPAFTGKSLDRTRPIFWEHEGNRAMRDGPWKIVAKGPSGAWELYNMIEDRTEMRDLAVEQPDRLASW